MKHKISEIIEFGERLIATGDLDPVYIALYKAKLPGDQLKRLLLAYFCFYHLGASTYLSEWEGEEFWGLMENAARNEIPPNMNGDLPGEHWPRGTERRHFRGKKCVDAVDWLRAYAPRYPENLIDDVFCLAKVRPSEIQAYCNLTNVMKRVQEWPMFGPWIAFKVADMLERILDFPIDFPNDIALLYKEPRATLDMLNIPPNEASEFLLEYFSKIPAPPSGNRFCGVAEVETCLCKTRSYWVGSYYLGKDIHEIRKGLVGWGTTADLLLACMPQEVNATLVPLEQAWFGT